MDEKWHVHTPVALALVWREDYKLTAQSEGQENDQIAD
jgi:hypothetical protein